MRRLRYFLLLVMLAVPPALVLIMRRPSPQPPLAVIGVVSDGDLQALSLDDDVPDGITIWASIFEELGAEVRFVRARDPIPADIDVLMLVRPRRRLSLELTINIWDYVLRGGSLVMALDPPSQVATEGMDAPLPAISWQEYAVLLDNAMLVHNHTGKAVVGNYFETFFQVYADEFTPHPITATLDAYDVPVLTWGTRVVWPDPIGPNGSEAFPLLGVDIGYGERSANALNSRRGEPVVMNMGVDYQGHLDMAGIGYDTEADNFIIAIGDSEMFQNEWGLGTDPDTGRPYFIGNYIFAQHLAAWLIGLPTTQWPDLPSGYTWISLDGFDSDWGDDAALTRDTVNEVTPPTADLSRIQAFRNDSYLYLMVQTGAPPTPATVLEIEADRDANGSVDSTLTLDATGVWWGDQRVADAAVAFGGFIEARLPLRLVGVHARIKRLCLDGLDCVEDVAVAVVDQLDPAPTRLYGPGVQVESFSDVNLRTAPGNYPITRLGDQTLLNVVGRDEAGEWLAVETARFEGWMATSVVRGDFDLAFLPVIEPPEVVVGFQGGVLATVRTAQPARLRTGPGTSFDEVAVLRDGDLVTAIGRTLTSDWIQVEREGTLGWLARVLLSTEGELVDLPVVEEGVSTLPGIEDGLLAVVAPDTNARMRSGPGTDFEIVTTVSSGQRLVALGRNDAADWIRVRDGDTFGWIAAFLLIVNGDIDSLPVVGAGATPDATATAPTPFPTSTTFDTTPIPTVEACPVARPTRIAVGDEVRVVPADGISFRDQPGLGAAILEYLPVNTTGVVIGGPVCLDDFLWWRLRVGGDRLGWAAEVGPGDYLLEPVE